MPVFRHPIEELRAMDGVSVFNVPAGTIVERLKIRRLQRELLERSERHCGQRASVGIEQDQRDFIDLGGNHRGPSGQRMVSHEGEAEDVSRIRAGLGGERPIEGGYRIQSVDGAPGRRMPDFSIH